MRLQPYNGNSNLGQKTKNLEYNESYQPTARHDINIIKSWFVVYLNKHMYKTTLASK